jgi:hypothetical protein
MNYCLLVVFEENGVEMNDCAIMEIIINYCLSQILEFNMFHDFCSFILCVILLNQNLHIILEVIINFQKIKNKPNIIIIFQYVTFILGKVLFNPSSALLPIFPYLFLDTTKFLS